jgi:hypothetical protein
MMSGIKIQYVLVVLGVSLMLVCGCSRLEEKRSRGVVVEYNGQIITEVELDRLTAGLSAEDSAHVAEQYIRQWASNLLMWDAATGEESDDIERQVADYRRSLYQHAWEQNIVDQRMPRLIEDSVVAAFYEANKSHFVLREPIIRGVLLVLPEGAPKQDELRKRLSNSMDEDNIEWIEKYAYQYARGYELFLDQWRPLGDVLQCVPFDQKTLKQQVKAGQLVQLQDTLSVYMLQLTEVCSAGESKPLDYVRGEIETMLLSERRVEFINKERERMYNKAVEQGKLKRYEK